MEPERMLIPAGTTLYRACDDLTKHKEPRVCPDTGKRGLYFGTYVFLSLAMAIEYDRDLQLGEFVTTTDISVFVGKYSFRLINPRRYFNDSMELKLQVDPTEDEQVPHFDNEMLPCVPLPRNPELPKFEGEVFLTDLSCVKLVKSNNINVSALRAFLQTDLRPDYFGPPEAFVDCIEPLC